MNHAAPGARTDGQDEARGTPLVAAGPVRGQRRAVLVALRICRPRRVFADLSVRR